MTTTSDLRALVERLNAVLATDSLQHLKLMTDLAAALTALIEQEPVAWAYYWPNGGLYAMHPYQLYQLHGSKIAEHSFREVPLYAAPPADGPWRATGLEPRGCPMPGACACPPSKETAATATALWSRDPHEQ